MSNMYAHLEYRFLNIIYLEILLSLSNLKYIEKLQTIFSPTFSTLPTRPRLAQI